MNATVLCTVNSTLSTCMAFGMASMYAARSVFGSVRSYLVVSGCVAGRMATVLAGISIIVGCVGGSDSWEG